MSMDSPRHFREVDPPLPPEKEIFRYLGYRGHRPEAHVREAVERCVGELLKAAEPKCVWREFPLEWEEGDPCWGGLRVPSRNLAGNLKDCHSLILFAATLGIGPDRLIARASVAKISDMAIYQAASAAMIEEVCHELNRNLAEEAAGRGDFLRPRFSPGYGDFSLAFQKDVLRLLDASRGAGISLTDSCLMLPSKSVTAVIGVSRINTGCLPEGCEACQKKDCGYRRNSSEGEEAAETAARTKR